jgi:hypothetical protein
MVGCGGVELYGRECGESIGSLVWVRAFDVSKDDTKLSICSSESWSWITGLGLWGFRIAFLRLII